MRSGERVRLAAAFVVTVLLTAGCSDPEAAPLPSASPTTLSPTPTPSVSASADYQTQAKAAVATYFAALYAAGLDPAQKTDELAALLAPGCTCRDVLEVLREEARLGRYIDYRYTVRDIIVLDAGPLGANVNYTVDQSAGAERDRRTGREVQRFAAVTSRYSAHFMRSDDRWLLDRVEELR